MLKAVMRSSFRVWRCGGGSGLPRGIQPDVALCLAGPPPGTEQAATSARLGWGLRIGGPTADVSLGAGVLLAQPIGDAPLAEALEEARHVAILLQRDRVAAPVAAGGEIRGRQTGIGQVAAAHDEPAVAGVLQVGERARHQRLGRYEAHIVA